MKTVTTIIEFIEQNRATILIVTGAVARFIEKRKVKRKHEKEIDEIQRGR